LYPWRQSCIIITKVFRPRPHINAPNYSNNYNKNIVSVYFTQEKAEKIGKNEIE
jgi:hypothetical protein